MMMMPLEQLYVLAAKILAEIEAKRVELQGVKWAIREAVKAEERSVP